MRILQATDCYPSPLVSGRGVHVRMPVHEPVRRGHDVQMTTLTGTRTGLDRDFPVHELAGWSQALGRFHVDPQKAIHPMLLQPGMVRSLADLIRQHRPQVVLAHSWILRQRER